MTGKPNVWSADFSQAKNEGDDASIHAAGHFRDGRWFVDNDKEF
jgi:hypothetical protein